VIAERAKAAGYDAVVFDRGGSSTTGASRRSLKALAQGAPVLMDNRGRGPSSGPDNRGRGPSSGPDNRGRGPSDRDNHRSRRRDNDEAPEFEERVVQINRVSKVSRAAGGSASAA
jgi:hypothetical protein